MNNSHLDYYIKAINKIDDYFEYANESLKDRAFIHKVLAELTENLSKYPVQPKITDEHGVLRFEKNPIVEYLLDNGGIDMNKIAIWCHENNIDPKYQQQFAQLIGYSVRGYGTLSYVTDENWEEVNE